jgi:hypothetical protein
VLEQFKGRGVQPLQIVKEQSQRVFRPGECAEKPPKHHLKAVLRVLRRKLGNGWLFPDDELQLRNEVDDELAVPAQQVPQGAPPSLHLRFALGEDLAHESLEGLCQGRVRNVALVPVELAGSEVAARRDKHLVQLVHNRGLTDTGIAAHQN